eukprot:snap_masked-scaffold_11-processed-gene-12.60-mRNA-1 protein AED:1.00 eAED:1.00 QI:0/-1/0/0/-1/1/1/0/150
MAAVFKRQRVQDKVNQQLKRQRREIAVLRREAQTSVDFTTGKVNLEIALREFERNSPAVPGQWSNIERVVLVGNIYDQLFNNPVLCKESWNIIVRRFLKHCDQLKIKTSRTRTSSAIQRYFKELKKENVAKNQTLFRALHVQWKLLKALN